ncbi:transposase [Escherichia coli]|nr:transposase [Escherichia coli]OKV78441.1 transposase [Escherichia coli]OKW08029.1 transposase [Escherichia coli]OKX18724.1 transposase [Escherichia coli]
MSARWLSRRLSRYGRWACLKLAKLGRWHDSKRTGRPCWVVMWDGWFRLQDMVEDYLMMKSLYQES